MAYVLDFNTRKKEYMTVVLPDEKKTRLMISTPSKTIIEQLTAMYSQLENVTDENEAGTFDEIYAFCAKLMSINKAGIKITKKHLESCCDIEDIFTFFYTYVDFVSSIANSKN